MVHFRCHSIGGLGAREYVASMSGHVGKARGWNDNLQTKEKQKTNLINSVLPHLLLEQLGFLRHTTSLSLYAEKV